MRRILSNTTALVACLTLSLPAPVAGQETQAEESEVCADGSAPPCAPMGVEPGAEADNGAAAGAEAEVEATPAPEEMVETEEPVESEADIAVDPEALKEGGEPAEAEAATTAAPERTLEAEEPVESEADIAVDPESLKEDGEPAEAEAVTAVPKGTLEAEEPVESEADIAIDPEGAKPDEPAPAAEADTTAAPDDTAVTDAKDADEVDSKAEEKAAADAEALKDEKAREADAKEVKGADSDGEKAESRDKKEEKAEDADARKARRAERDAKNAKKSGEEAAAAETTAAEEAASAAKSAAAAKAPADAKAKVTEETVTKETSRSSDENFASRLTDVFDGSSDGDDNRKVLIGTVLGALGGFAASQLLADRQVVASSDDRVVVQRADGEYQLLKDETALLRQPGSQVRTETFDDGSTRTTVTREDGSKIVTIRDGELRVVRRSRITTDGREVVLIDDTVGAQAVDVSKLPKPAAPMATTVSDEDALRRALRDVQRPDRSYSLAQVREISGVRALAPAIELDNVTFETGSAAIRTDQAEQLNELGQLLARMIDENPREIFLVEGHTDAVGDAAMNLALSDRRAESVALALTEYFDVPPENLVVQGYGERYLQVPTDGPERLNRRASVRRITELLQVASAD